MAEPVAAPAGEGNDIDNDSAAAEEFAALQAEMAALQRDLGLDDDEMAAALAADPAPAVRHLQLDSALPAALCPTLHAPVQPPGGEW